MVAKTANENEHDGSSDDGMSITMRKDGVNNEKKGLVIIRKRRIATATATVFFLLATIMMLMMVVYYPGGNNDHNNNNNNNNNNSLIVDGTSDNIRSLADGLERNIYNPNVDYCFKLKNVDKYCWYPTCSCPYGDWEETIFSLNDNPNDSGCGSQCHWYPSYSCPWTQCTDVDSSNGGTTPEPTESPPPPRFPQNDDPQNDDGNGNNIVNIGKVDAATESGSDGSYIGISTSSSSSLIMLMTTIAIVIVGYNTK